MEGRKAHRMTDHRKDDNGWQWKSLESIAADGAPILYGILQPGADTPGGVPYVRPSEINSDVIDLSSIRRTTAAIASKYKRSTLIRDDIILSIVGTIGKVALVPPELDGGNITQSSVRIRVKPEITSPRYVAWALRSPYLRRQFDQHRLGTAVPRLNVAHVRALRVPVAPLDEQQRIVAEIEKQFTRLDAGVASLKRLQTAMKRYRTSVLKAACEGRLVPTEAELARKENRSYETGEQLLQRLLKERREKWNGKGTYKEPPPIESSDLPTAPEGWTWVRFDLLGDDPFNTVQTGPFGAQLHNTEFIDKGMPVIAVGNLTGTGFTDTGLYFVSPSKAEQLRRYDVWSGDVLFARSGATLGKVCVAPDHVQDWRMTGHILRARLNRTVILPEIAVFALAALPAVRRQVFGNVRGVTRPGFNTALLESIRLPLPPVAEQKRIVPEVERRLSVIEELETVTSTELQRATRLRGAILARAFRG